MKKTLIALLLIFTMTISGLYAFADTSAGEDAVLSEVQQTRITFLYKMDIIEGEDISDGTMTRGEFAYVLSRLSGLSDGIFAGTVVFSDVPESHKYAKAIAIASALGCMNGIGNNEFGIQNKISYTDATVALVRLLGYESMAQYKGGYPKGYLSCAATLGLHKGIDTENERANIMLMCYNALLADSVGLTSDYERGHTLLENIHGVSTLEGIVSGNRFTCIGQEDSGLQPDEIKIGGEIYLTEDVSFAEHIGEYVKGYYFYDEDADEKWIVSLTVQEDMFDKLVIEDKSIISAENNTVTYIDENDDTETVKLRAGFDYILNNCTVNDRTTADLKVDDGELTLIDFENDGTYDLAMVKRIETMVYQGADNTEDLIFCKEGIIHTDPFDKSYFCEIIYIDQMAGTEESIAIDELTADDVLTVYRSEDGKFLRIYAVSNNVYGYIESVSDEEVVIDGVAYELPLKTPKEELTVGAKVSFSADMFGRLVYLDEESSAKGPFYGYLFDYAKAKGLGVGKVKILNGTGSLVFDCAQKVTVDDDFSCTGSTLESCSVLFENGAVKRQLVRYSLNGNGELKALYTTSGTSSNSIKKQGDISKDVATKYYHWHNIWAGKYVLPEDNFFLVIPTVGDEAENEELYTTTYAFGTDVNTEYVEIYDVDDTMEAGAVLLYSKMALEGKVNTTADTSVGIFVKGRTGVDGEIAYLYADGEIRSYVVNPDNYSSLSEFAFGDVVRYVVTQDGRISTLYTVLDVGTTGENTPVPTLVNDGNYYHSFSRVYKKLDDYLVAIPNYNNPTFDTSVSNRIVIPNKYNTCLFVDMSSNRILSGSFDSITPYFENDGRGGCYVYTRLYKWARSIEVIIYKF